MNVAIFAGAYILDLILGDPKRWPHPVKMMGWFIERGEEPLRKRFEDYIAGAVLTFSLIILTYLITSVICYLSFRIDKFLGLVVNVILGYTTISARSLIEEAAGVKRELLKKNLPRARIRMSQIVARDTKDLSEEDVIRGTIETVAENTTDGIIAPLFYLAIGGVPLAMAYKAINTLDSMVGYRDKRYIKFGRASAVIDEIVNFIPARISALGFIISSWFCGQGFKNGFYYLCRNIFSLHAVNSILTEGVIASILGIRLGGINYYNGREVLKPYLGIKRREMEIEDIDRASKLTFLATLLFVFAVALIKII